MASPSLPASAEALSAPPSGARWPLRLRSSLQGRLVLAYILVGLLPMLFAAELASRVVTRAFEDNLRVWLRETATYFVSSMIDAQHEASEVSAVLTQDPGLVGEFKSGTQGLSPLIRMILRAEGFDLLQILDEHGEVVYSSEPVREQQPVRLGRDVVFTQVRTAQDKRLMISARSSFEHQNRRYQLVLGTWLDSDFFSHISDITSFDFRLFEPSGADGGFRRIFQSSQSASSELRLNPAVVAALREQASEYFARDVDHSTYTGLYLPLRDDAGRLQGVVFCGLRSSMTATRWVTRTSVFLFIFLTGTLLSVAIGYAVSRWLTRPLRSLANSVRAITAGDYSSRVAVQGHDEVAELADSFNAMASRLEQLKHLEMQLRQQDRLSALGEAAAGIAHEVRNPLGVICTSAELIRNRYTLNERDQKLIDNVISEVRRIDRLIGDFLSYARSQPIRLTALSPSALLAQVTQVCAPELARRRIELQIDDQAQALRVEGDPDALHQAVLNIILNACEAMPGGGQLRIGLSARAGQLQLRFRDSGGGIAPALIDRIFEPFVTSKPNGTGLGLAKTRSIIEAHGGQIRCRNVSGGTVFEISLPVLI